VLDVSKRVLKYFTRRANVTKNTVLQSMQAITEQPHTLGHPGFAPQSEEEGTQILLDQVQSSLPAHLNVHGKFSYVIYAGKDKDFDDGTAAKILGKAVNHFDQLMPPQLGSSDSEHDGNPELGRPRVANSRDKQTRVQHIYGLAPASEVQENPRPLRIPETIKGRPTNSGQTHLRGGDQSFLNETKRWTQEARLLYDMPVMAGPSGSAAYMLNTAMVLGLPPAQLPTYTLALVGSIVGGGHHTFHEIMTVAAQVGVPYVRGNYLSAIPAAFWRDGQFNELVHQFFEPAKDFSTRTRSDDSAPSDETAQQLQFGLPPIVDDGMISMARTIAARLGVSPEDIHIKAVADGSDTKGVSGSPVFMVTCKGQRVGVVKVFQKFAEMAQELSAMAMVNDLRQPGLAAPHVLGLGKLVKGSSQGSLVKDTELGYVFSTIAAGKPLDDLMQAVGKATDGPRATALSELLDAVAAVGRELALLHNQPDSGGKVGASFIKLHVDKVLNYAADVQNDERVRRVFGDTGLVVLARRLSEKFTATPGTASLSHGDAHPGNFFYDDKSVTAIDTPTMDTSIGREQPIGSPARDYVNFRIKLATVGRSFQLTPQEVTQLQQHFIRAYDDRSERRKVGSMPAAEKFFALRTLLSELKTAIADAKHPDILRVVEEIGTLR